MFFSSHCVARLYTAAIICVGLLLISQPTPRKPGGLIPIHSRHVPTRPPRVVENRTSNTLYKRDWWALNCSVLCRLAFTAGPMPVARQNWCNPRADFSSDMALSVPGLVSLQWVGSPGSSSQFISITRSATTPS